MIETLRIIRENETDEVKIWFQKVGDYWEVNSEPKNLTIEDSVLEMLEDINKWDIKYLKEVLKDNNTFSATKNI